MNEKKDVYETGYRVGCFFILFFVGLIGFAHLIGYLFELNTSLEYLGGIALIIILSGAFGTFGYVLGLIFDIDDNIRNKKTNGDK